MPDELEAQQASSSIFPFLSVLCCVIGTMVLILVAGSLNAAGMIGPELAKLITETRGDLSQLETREKELEKLKTDADALDKNLGRIDELDDLKKSLEEVKSSVKDAMARLEKVRKETTVFLEAPKKKEVLVQQKGAQLERDSGLGALAAAQGKVDGLTAERDRLKRDRQEALGRLDAAKTRVLVDGVEVRLALIDVHVDSVTLLSEGLAIEKGTTFTRAEAAGSGGVLDRLASEIARPGKNLYPVLLVRPGAVELHDEAAYWFRKRRVDYSHEPVDEDWLVLVQQPVTPEGPPADTTQPSVTPEGASADAAQPSVTPEGASADTTQPPVTPGETPVDTVQPSVTPEE